jgi:hypothetical protein
MEKYKILAKVDLLTRKDRRKNSRFGLADRFNLHKSNYRKSRIDGGKRGCFDPDFWQKINNIL